MGETVPDVLSTARGRTPTESTVSVRVDVIQSARSIANQNKKLQHDF